MEDQSAPRWAAYVAGSIGLLVPAIGAAMGLYFLFRKKQTAANEADAAQVAKAKREALQEAWDTYDKLNQRLESQEVELQQIRGMLQKCREDRAALRLIAIWAKSYGMEIPQEMEDILRDPSATHSPVAATPKTDSAKPPVNAPAPPPSAKEEKPNA